MYYDMEKCGTRIEKLRKMHDLTQEELAEKLHITQGFLSQVESGTRGMSIDLCLQISEELEVSTEFLLKGIEINGEGKAMSDSIKESVKKFISQLEAFSELL